MKRFVVLLVLCAVFTVISPVFASESDIKVVINGELQIFDQSPVVKNGRTLVPMRKIFEALGGSVSWEDQTETASALKGDTTVSLKINSGTATVTSRGTSKSVPLDAPAQLINGRTMVPLRFVSEALGARVEWDGNTQTANITAIGSNPGTSVTSNGYVPTVVSADPNINRLLMEPWTQKPDGTVIMTLGDAFKKHFGTDDWGKYTDVYGRDLIGFKGTQRTAFGISVSVEFYFDYEAAELVYFKMGGEDEDVMMGRLLIKQLSDEDKAEWVQSHTPEGKVDLKFKALQIKEPLNHILNVTNITGKSVNLKEIQLGEYQYNPGKGFYITMSTDKPDYTMIPPSEHDFYAKDFGISEVEFREALKNNDSIRITTVDALDNIEATIEVKLIKY